MTRISIPQPDRSKPPKQSINGGIPPHTGTNMGSNIINQFTSTIKQNPLIFIGLIIAGVIIIKKI